MKLLITSILTGIVLTLGSFWSSFHQTQPAVGIYYPTGGGTYRLQSSVGTSDASLTLSSFKEPVSNIPYTMSYLNSDIEYGTLDPQTSHAEFVSFTGVTQNSDGTATLTGLIRGLSRSPGTIQSGSPVGCIASTTLAQSHSGQSIFILSNPPCQLAEYMPLRTTATSTAVLVFSSTTPPRYDKTGVQHNGTYLATTSEFASIDYVNAISFSGAPTAVEGTKGIVDLATALQQASSTSAGNAGSLLVMQSKYATDTPQIGCATGYSTTAGAGCSIIADLTGHLKQVWLDLTASFNTSGAWTNSGAWVFNNATTTVGASSNLTVASSTPLYGYSLNVGGKSLFTGGVSIGNASTTMSNGTLVVSGTASTTNLTVSGTCTNCVAPTIVNSGATACTNGVCTIAASCTGTRKVVGGGYLLSTQFVNSSSQDSYPSNATTWTFDSICGGANCGTPNVTVYAICVNP